MALASSLAKWNCEAATIKPCPEAGDNNLQQMRVDQFAGVEFYPGGATIPSQYNKTGSSCGVLLLWTRER